MISVSVQMEANDTDWVAVEGSRASVPLSLPTYWTINVMLIACCSPPTLAEAFTETV